MRYAESQKPPPSASGGAFRTVFKDRAGSRVKKRPFEKKTAERRAINYILYFPLAFKQIKQDRPHLGAAGYF